eukprot:13788014-Ditylum_brightwellii.AAC.1
MRKRWPPPGLCNTQAKYCDFNDFRHLIDEHETLVAQWVYNDLVLLVSTINYEGLHVLVNRRRPHVTVRNKEHVAKVWVGESKEGHLHTIACTSLQPVGGGCRHN